VLKLRWISITGCPDLLVIRTGGRVLWVEVKSDYGRLRGMQRWFHSKLQSYQHEVITLRPRGFDAFKEKYSAT
jgi:hypothetical protein